ncbi:MAG: 6-phosphogluconolactonase [Gemmatimonadota bacterium]
MAGDGVGRSGVEILADTNALADAAAELFADSAERAIAASGRFVVALSGGSTPRRAYERLARAPFATRIPWTAVHVIWGDERCVAPTDADSNYRMAFEALLAHVPLPPSNVHRMHGEDDPTRAAASYETELRTLLHTPAGSPSTEPGQRIDLALLGLGDNGHTASIFPESDATRETVRWAMAESVDASPSYRITLTAPLLNAAAEVLFLVSGKTKTEMLTRVLDGPRRPGELPAQLIAPTNGRLRWLVDVAAAARLQRSS